MPRTTRTPDGRTLACAALLPDLVTNRIPEVHARLADRL